MNSIFRKAKGLICVLAVISIATLTFIPSMAQVRGNESTDFGNDAVVREWLQIPNVWNAPAKGKVPFHALMSGSAAFTGPTTVDGNAVHDGVRAAMASWNAVAHATIRFSTADGIDASEPVIGNGQNEIGWVERSDSPYFIPGVPCTVVVIYDTASGVMDEADAACNAMAYQWPDVNNLARAEEVLRS